MSVPRGRLLRVPTYDAQLFTDPTPRVPGFHDVQCRITWTPHAEGAACITVSGDYLDAESPMGAVSLGCGIESALHDLGISDLIDYDHLVTVADLVSAQLARQPRAEVNCRHGKAVLELVPRSSFGPGSTRR